MTTHTDARGLAALIADLRLRRLTLSEGWQIADYIAAFCTHDAASAKPICPFCGTVNGHHDPMCGHANRGYAAPSEGPPEPTRRMIDAARESQEVPPLPQVDETGLLPCAHCGGKAMFVVGARATTRHPASHYVMCTTADCNIATAMRAFAADAAQDWNRRAAGTIASAGPPEPDADKRMRDHDLLHCLRNPWGKDDMLMRKVRLEAADRIETLAAQLAEARAEVVRLDEQDSREWHEFKAMAETEQRRAEAMRDALVIAKSSIQQGASLDAHIAANGPTVRAVIDAALAPQQDAPQ